MPSKNQAIYYNLYEQNTGRNSILIASFKSSYLAESGDFIRQPYSRGQIPCKTCSVREKLEKFYSEGYTDPNAP